LRNPLRLATGLLGLAIAAWGLMGSGEPAQAATVSIDVGNNWFCNSSFQNGTCTTNIDVSDTVEWTFTTSLAHTTSSTSPSKWNSGSVTGPGETFSHTFNEAGVYSYRCNIHPTTMHGEIVVGSEATETDTQEPATNTPTPTQTNTPEAPTNTPTQSNTPTITNTPTQTNTPGAHTSTPTQADTATMTNTPAATPTGSTVPPSATTTLATPTDTEEPSATPTPQPTATGTSTPAPTVTATSTPTVATTIGDVDCNGSVTAIDGALILQRAAGLLALLPCPENADTNGDGREDAIDATLVLQFNAGLIDHLPPGGAAG
jgi:plastocyanin